MEAIDFGVCRLSIVQVRNGPADSTALVTQLLFGDHYEVIHVSPDKKWLRIRIITDLCDGWIDARQHHSITASYLEQIGLADFKITTDITATLLYKKSPLTIVMGSIVPISTTELFKMEEQFAFNGETKSLGQRRDFEYLKTIVSRYVNAPYVPGGKSPFGIDAGALVQMVFKICGYHLARNPWQQVEQGKKVNSLGDAKPGDVAFFSEGGNVVHAGILLEEERVIHSFGQVRIDPINDEGILRADTKIYTHHLTAIRRYLA